MYLQPIHLQRWFYRNLYFQNMNLRSNTPPQPHAAPVIVADNFDETYDTMSNGTLNFNDYDRLESAFVNEEEHAHHHSLKTMTPQEISIWIDRFASELEKVKVTFYCLQAIPFLLSVFVPVLQCLLFHIRHALQRDVDVKMTPHHASKPQGSTLMKVVLKTKVAVSLDFSKTLRCFTFSCWLLTFYLPTKENLTKN